MSTSQDVKQSFRELLQEHKEAWSLTKKIGVDAITALTAGLTVTPIMVAIDRAVIEAAAGHSSVLLSMRTSVLTMARHPLALMRNRPFGLMFMLYVGTYFTANAIDTLTSHSQGLPANSTTSSTAKLGTVSAVNVGLSVYKDSQFARTFGRVSARSLPPASFATFVVRDGLTLFATFNLPQLVAPSLPSSMDAAVDRLSIAQLVMPAAMQAFATPLHLLGLDLYSRNGKVPWRDRVSRVSSTWVPATLARMCRIIPAYGLGGIVNTRVRSQLMDLIE